MKSLRSIASGCTRLGDSRNPSQVYRMSIERRSKGRRFLSTLTLPFVFALMLDTSSRSHVCADINNPMSVQMPAPGWMFRRFFGGTANPHVWCPNDATHVESCSNPKLPFHACSHSHLEPPAMDLRPGDDVVAVLHKSSEEASTCSP